MTAPDVWADGAMTAQAAAEYLGGLSARTVERIAGAEKWPSKLVTVPGSKTGRRVYPARLVKQFLAACADA